MGHRGPPPTPTALRVLHGDRPSRISANEMQPAKGVPRPPRWLPREERQYWRLIVRDIEKTGVLTLADATMLGMLASALADFVEAKQLIAEEGIKVPGRDGANARCPRHGEPVEGDQRGCICVGRVRNPACMLRDRARDQVHRIALQFGLTPASRVGLDVLPQGAQSDLESLLS